jgi:hypothetical protein
VKLRHGREHKQWLITNYSTGRRTASIFGAARHAIGVQKLHISSLRIPRAGWFAKFFTADTCALQFEGAVPAAMHFEARAGASFAMHQ